MCFDVKPWQPARVRGVRGGRGEGALAWKRNSKTEKAQHSTADEGEQTEEKFALTPGRPSRGTKRASVLVKMCGRRPGSVCVATWTGFPPLRASLLIRAVEPQQLEDAFN